MPLDPAPRLALPDHFAALDDPRVEQTKLHPFLSIVAVTICTVLSGGESWDDIAQFSEVKAEWFATFLDLPNGIPSQDTFNRVFAALDPVQFRTCFLHWMQSGAGVLPAQVIALDAKTVRRSHDWAKGKQASYMVNACAGQNRLVLAQVKVDDKSNEITALPDLLGQLAVAGCPVTIDAMGCQREIARQILDQGGDYVLGLKGNQGTLHENEDAHAHSSRPAASVSKNLVASAAKGGRRTFSWPNASAPGKPLARICCAAASRS